MQIARRDIPDHPTLSVIVPILDEAAKLPQLFATLATQQGGAFELILIDGGSTDGSLQVAEELAAGAPFPCRIERTQRGRGRQFNAGVALSCAETLLFLHADSRFVDPQALAGGLLFLKQAVAATGHDCIAGHFSLRFFEAGPSPSFGYYFLAWKARLDRPGCIHGDQGYLMRRAFFDSVGPFDETLGYLEDNRLAQAVREQGCWLLLPFDLVTSPRRYEEEGFCQRQTLNALIMTLAALGRDDLLRLLPGLYRQQSRAQILHLRPFFQLLAEGLRQKGRREAVLFWYRTGRYLIANTWQLALWWDVRQAYRRGAAPGAGATPWLNFFDRYMLVLVDHPAGYTVAGLVAWFWFQVQLRGGRRC